MRIRRSQLRRLIREELRHDPARIWDDLDDNLRRDLLRIAKHRRISVAESVWERLKAGEYIDRAVDRLHQRGLLQNSAGNKLAVTNLGYEVAKLGGSLGEAKLSRIDESIEADMQTIEKLAVDALTYAEVDATHALEDIRDIASRYKG